MTLRYLFLPVVLLSMQALASGDHAQTCENDDGESAGTAKHSGSYHCDPSLYSVNFLLG